MDKNLFPIICRNSIFSIFLHIADAVFILNDLSTSSHLDKDPNIQGMRLQQCQGWGQRNQEWNRIVISSEYRFYLWAHVRRGKVRR